MSTGPSSDSAEQPQEPEPPFRGKRRRSWLASHGRHPVTWGAAALVLVASVGVALLQHEPGVRARAQSVYCGLVTCAVLRSAAATSPAQAEAAPPSVALPSSPPPAHAAAPAHSSSSAAASKPAAAHPAKPHAAPAPAPSPKLTPGPPHPSWPPHPQWPWPGAGGGGHWHHHHRPPGGYGPSPGSQQPPMWGFR
jgi:hypothetical protein